MPESYYVTATMIGGTPDKNRRAVRRWPDDEIMRVFNERFEEWTPEMQRELDAYMAELNRRVQLAKAPDA